MHGARAISRPGTSASAGRTDHGAAASSGRRGWSGPAGLLLVPDAVGQTRGVGEKSNDGSAEPVVVVATLALLRAFPASTPRSLELSTANWRDGGFARQPRLGGAVREGRRALRLMPLRSSAAASWSGRLDVRIVGLRCAL
jgi:hypothetical protein